MYHEFVYVSDAKVRQFVPAKAAWWQGMRAKKLGAKLKFSPVEAALEVEPSEIAADTKKLHNLIRYLEESGRYYTEPDVIPGEWVMFDGRIGIAHVDTPPVQGAVLFCEAEPITVTTPRIMLHGSARHLEPGMAPLPARDQGVGEDGGYSVPTPSCIAEIIGAINNPRSPDLVRRFRHVFDRSAHVNTELWQNLTIYFREVACTGNYREFSPYLGGHARITAVLRPPQLPFPVVLASPLYVRYERP